jgi:WD40 repeat protein
LYSGPLNKITGVSCFRFQKLFAACDISGNIFVWDVVSRRLVYHINVETNFTSLECCQWTSLLAVGDQKGFLRIYHVQNGLRLIMKRRVHSGAINSVHVKTNIRCLLIQWQNSWLPFLMLMVLS